MRLSRIRLTFFLNRANGRLRLFKKPADFLAFEQILAEVFERLPLRFLGYTLMGNHWHFVVWPQRGQDDERGGQSQDCSAHDLRQADC